MTKIVLNYFLHIHITSFFFKQYQNILKLIGYYEATASGDGK